MGTSSFAFSPAELANRTADPVSAVLAAHVDYAGKKGAFFNLRSIPEGAEVFVVGPDGRELTLAWQTGPGTRDWPGTRLPAGSGLHGLVLASQQPHCANQLYLNPRHDRELDRRLGGVLCAEVIVPFYIARQLKGVVVALQTKPAADSPDPSGFDPEALEEIELLATSLGRLLDYRLLCLALGVDE